MKILYLTHQYFPRHVGGTEVYLKGLVDHAKQVGHEVRIITCHESPVTEQADFHTQRINYDETDVLEIHFNLSVTPNPAEWEYANPFTANIVKEEIEAFKPNLVHIIHAMKLSGSVLEVCHQMGVPFFVTLCDFWFICPRHTLLKWDNSLCKGPRHPLDCRKCVADLHGYASFTKFSLPKDLLQLSRRNRYLMNQLKKAKKIIALSPFQRNMFIENGFPSDSIEVISHGLETSFLTPKIHPQQVKTVGFIGSLVPFKGVHILIEAIRSNPSLPIHCLIYGHLDPSSSYAAHLKKLADQDARIQFKGKFPPQQLGSILENIDILAMPALWYENEPLIVKSALYMGIPVLASNIGSLPELVTHGINGWLEPPGDASRLNERLQKVLSEPPLRFSPPKIKTIEENAEELEEIYTERDSKIGISAE